MKKIVMTAAIVLASFGANASNVKPTLSTPIAKVIVKPQPVYCSVSIGIGIASIGISWCCANCD